MRKITALILSVLMIAATLTFFASAAPAGTAVSTAEEFAAMAADGQYYLSADITISASYASSFTGTFDGNGHTVTVTAPMFINVNGATIKNLTTVGEVATSIFAEEFGYSANASAAVAACANGNCTFENIVNKADILPGAPDNTKNSFFGGILGIAIGATDFTFTNCVNEGKVIYTGATGNVSCGGIIGLTVNNVKNTFITDCLNNGEIYAKSVAATGASGGMIGWVQGSGSDTLIGCVNNGKIGGYSKSSTGRIGGFIGYTIATLTTFKDCINNGSVTADADTAVNACVAGFVGYNNQTAAKTQVVMSFTNCTNTADLSYTGTAPAAYLAGFVGYTRLACDFINCLNSGNITSDYTGEGSKNYDAGGLVSVLGASGIDCPSTFKNCVNTGNLISDNYRAGGMTSYVYGTANGYPIFDGCVVICDIISGQYAGGLASYFNTDGVVVKNCYINVPTIESPADPLKANAFFWDNKCAPKEGNVSGNIVISNTKYLMAAGADWNTVAWSDSTPGVEMANPGALATVPSEADIKSGKVAYEYNQAVGATVLYQDLANGGLPTTVKNEEHEVLFADGKYSNPVKEPETTEPPVSEPTGDVAPIFMIIAAVSVLGVAIVAKKREN